MLENCDVGSMTKMAVEALPHSSAGGKRKKKATNATLLFHDGIPVARDNMMSLESGKQLTLLDGDELFLYAPQEEDYRIDLGEGHIVTMSTASSVPRAFVLKGDLVVLIL